MDIEVCIDANDVASTSYDVHQVALGGAQRIELCAQINQQGLTPSRAVIEAAREHFPQGELLVMIRPHNNGFCYSEADVEAMIKSCLVAHQAGADGLVFGALDANGKLDTLVNAQLTDLARSLGLKTTFHRAFDALISPGQFLESLSQLQINRILTSGCDWESGFGIEQGLEQISQWQSSEFNSFEWVLAGKVGLSNAQLLAQWAAKQSTSNPTKNKQKISLHTFSGVQTDGRVDASKVAALVAMASNPSVQQIQSSNNSVLPTLSSDKDRN